MLNLMQPGKIGNLELKNRIIMAPMGPHFEDIGPKLSSISPHVQEAAQP